MSGRDVTDVLSYWMMAMLLTKILLMAMIPTLHVLLSNAFTNEFDEISSGRLFRQVAHAGSLALPAAVPSYPLGRHCSEQLHVLPMAKHPCFVANSRTFEAGQLTRG